MMAGALGGDVLVVDDTHASLKLLVDLLTAEGFHVRAADSGELALASATAAPPELILLDIHMDGMDGYEVFRQLQAQETTRGVPVIFVTASAGPEQLLAGLGLGAVDYISKPYRREELLARIRNHLELYQIREKLKRQTLFLETANERLETEVAERMRLEKQLRAEHERQKQLATHDTLTKLPNRRSFEKALRRAVSRARRGTPSALLFMDIDHFKQCNDSRGHAFGDSVLRAVADELAAETRGEDIVARVGGDEFAAILERADEGAARSVAGRIRARVQALAGTLDVRIDLSVGVALVDADSTLEGLLVLADRAMYGEKNSREHDDPTGVPAKDPQ